MPSTREPFHIIGVCFLLFLLMIFAGCGKSDPTKDPAPPSPIQKKQKASKKSEAKGELHLRVESGILVREDRSPSSPVIHVVEQPQLLRVLEKDRDRYRVALPGLEGWIAAGQRARELRVLSTRRPPQPAVTADPQALATARRYLDGPQDLRCGPYGLLTDIRAPSILNLCRKLAADLDKTYADTYGLRPLGEPRETLILFREASAFRRFSKDSSPGFEGYAGHAKASDGFLALYAGDRPIVRIAQTLAHELTHLVNRRALGAPLPRWLSEGLADGIGDPAGPNGLGRAQGLKGSEAMARRVVEIPDLPDIESLLSQENSAFDRNTHARDYEQSAVLIRFLMSDPERARRFQAFLKSVSEGKDAGARGFKEHVLGEDSWSSFDRELRHWLKNELR